MNQKNLRFDGFKGAIPLFTHQKDGQVKPGYLGGIFGCLGALKGAPGVTDG